MVNKTNAITLPINLALGVGAYTTKLYIGSEQTPVHVLLDTGSSTLAIDQKVYQATSDQHLTTTTYAQDVVYGSGGWAGPVIHTQVQLDHEHGLQLAQAPVAITATSQQQNFQQADGIWGLAYHHLNKAYDVSSYLQAQQPALDSTHPWPFTVEPNPTGMRNFRKYLRSFPEHDITPLFTAYEEQQITANQFALLTHRSIEYVPKPDMSTTDIAAEPLNQGQFHIGVDATEHAEKRSTQVFHDAYYNTHLQAIRIAGFDACEAPPLDPAHEHNFFTNAIIDSGCSFLVLQKQLYAYVLDCLQQINPAFSSTIEAFTTALEAGKDYQNKQLKLTDWPALYMTFSGPDKEPIELCIPAENYWQQHAKGPDNWYFMLMDQMPQWPDQSICGLPLINSYYCVFDRSADSLGAIHWIDKNQ